MKMKKLKSIALIFLAAFLLGSCSGDDEDEKGRIDTMTEEAGKEAVRWIKTPIEKAQNVADKEEERVKEFDERNKE